MRREVYLEDSRLKEVKMNINDPWTWPDGSLIDGFGSRVSYSRLYYLGHKPKGEERREQFEAKYLKSILFARLSGETRPLAIGANVRPLKTPVIPSQLKGVGLTDTSVKTVTHISYFLPHKDGKKMWFICLRGIECENLPVWFNLENFEVIPEPLD